MRLALRRYVRYRMERFGGMVLNAHGRVFFVKPEVIRSLHRREASLEMYRFLVSNAIAEPDLGVSPETSEWSRFLLSEIGIPADMNCLSEPLVLSLFVTRACNLACPHCATNAGVRADHELSEAEWCSVLDEAYELGVFAISISGGEPLTRPDILSILRHADSLGLPVTLLTNGLLLDEQTISRLPPNVALLVSLDGLGEAHECFQAHCNYPLIMRNVRLLREANRRFALTSMFTRVNKAQTRKVLEHFLLGEGIPVIPTPILPLGRASGHRELLLGEDDVDDFVALKRTKRDYYEARIGSSGSQSGPRSFGIDDMTELIESAFWACSGTRSDLAIRYDGTVYPCINCLCTEAFPLGSIRFITLRELWHSCLSTRSFRGIVWDDFTGCARCDVSDYCNFRCPALSLVAHGNPLVCGADAFTKEAIRRGAREHLSDSLRPLGR